MTGGIHNSHWHPAPQANNPPQEIYSHEQISRIAEPRSIPHHQSRPKSPTACRVEQYNEALRNKTPFDVYWRRVEDTVRTPERRSSRSKEREARIAGFREWWDKGEGNLMEMRREHDEFVAERARLGGRAYRGRRC